VYFSQNYDISRLAVVLPTFSAVLHSIASNGVQIGSSQKGLMNERKD